MSNRVHIICHPESGSGKGQKVWNEVTSILDDFQMEYLSYMTNYELHVGLIVQQIVERGYQPVVEHLLVIGGDGTLHEVVSELHKLDQRIPVNYIPSGTGNDFARVWYPNISARESIETVLFRREVLQVPIFQFINNITGQRGIVLNSIGFGFDAMVNHKQQELSANSFLNRLPFGVDLYKVAVAMSLNAIPHFDAHITIDGQSIDILNNSILSVLNNPYVGGGLLLDNITQASTPEIALISFHDVNFLGIRDLISRVLFTKTHDESPYISRYTGQNLHLQINQPIRGQVDGEDLSELEVDYSFKVSSYPFKLPRKK